jgi:hypothetical protein
MTTTVTPDSKQDHTASQEWPTLAPDLADSTGEDRADGFDRTQVLLAAAIGTAIASEQSIHTQKSTT